MRSRTHAALAALLAVPCAPAQATPQLLWTNPWSNQATVASYLWTSPPANLEAADDFDVSGTITRIVIDANGCSNCASPTIAGAEVRFYQWNAGAVGAQLHRSFVPAGSPGLRFDPLTPQTIDVTLPAPFLASGRHWVSVQLHFVGGGYWNVWVSNPGSPRLSPVRVRDHLGSGTWGPAYASPWSTTPLHADLTFQLWGVPAGSSGQQQTPCVTWSELSTTRPAGANHSLLRAIKVFAHDDVWAVGHSTIPIGPDRDQFTTAMHWDGLRWSIVPSPSPGPAPGLITCQLWALDGVASNDLWAAGTYKIQVPGGWVGQQVFAMHWDGSSWTVPPGLPLPNTSIGAGVSGSRVLGVKAIFANDVWFVGDWLDVVSSSSGQTIRPGLLTHWDGSSFTQFNQPIVTGVGHQYFNAIDASGPADIWVVGGAGVAGNLPGSPTPVIFHYDGSRWTHRVCPTPGNQVNLYDVEVRAPNDVWIFGISSTQLPSPTATTFMVHWNGSTWTRLPGPPGGVSSKVFAANDIWSAGSRVWHWNGNAWSQSHAFTSVFEGGLSAIDGILPCQLFGAGGQSLIGQVWPFVARQDSLAYWHANERMPSVAAAAPASLRMTSPPRPGGSLTVAIDDPQASHGAPSASTLWLVALAPAPGFPTPMPFPIGGASGRPGELFIDPTSLGYISPPVTRGAGQGPVTHGLPVPNDLALLGSSLFTQGVMLDPAQPANLIVTNGLDLRVGW